MTDLEVITEARLKRPHITQFYLYEMVLVGKSIGIKKHA